MPQIKSFIDFCCNESFKTCMAILCVAALYSTVDAVHFYKNLATFFPCHLYIAKILTMDTLCSTEITSVMQMSPSA